MFIQCPHCSYTRDMPAAKIPEGIVIAHCPQCGQKFRFSAQVGVLPEGGNVAKTAPSPSDEVSVQQGQAPQESPKARPESTDSPLPPNATVIEPSDPFRHEGATHEEKQQPLHSAEPQGKQRSEREQAEQEPMQAAAKEQNASSTQERLEQQQQSDVRQGEEEDEGWTFNPWECARTPQEFVVALYSTCMRVMFAPARFFADLRPTSTLRALCFFLVLCALQTFVEHLWGVFFIPYIKPIAENDAQVQQLLTLMLDSQQNFLMNLLLRCAMLTLQLYIFAAILTLSMRFVASGRSNFSLVFQVLCYAEAPTILCIVPVAGSILALIWSFACVIIGCKVALRLNWGQAILGFSPLLILLIFSYLQFFTMIG